MQPALSVALCGPLRVELGGERIEDALSGRQGREVFAYLVLNRGRSVSRDELAALLWPDKPPRAPEAALNTILARLRRVLGHSIIPGRSQLGVELGPESWVDVRAAEEGARRAESLLADAHVAEALELAGSTFDLVAAPLLPEVQHAWTDQWRSEVDDICTRLLIVTARCGLTLGGPNLVEAERAARRLIEREPFRESGYSMLMEVHAARGDVAEALLVYERLRGFLRDELGIPPSPGVASLHERLLTQGASRSEVVQETLDESNHALALPRALARNSCRQLVGRKAERAALLEHWNDLPAETGSVVALAGEPGIGKTMLASWLAREAHREGAAVLYGQAYEEALVPYAPLVEALRHLVIQIPDGQLDQVLGIHLGALGWLIPELAEHRTERPSQAADPRIERLRLYHAVAALVAHAASLRPVLLVLEDMQYADKDTLLMVRQLLRDAARRPILVLLTYRDGEIAAEHPLSRLLCDLRRDLGLTNMVLRGLEHDEIAELWEPGDRPAPDLIEHLGAHTSGNPFFIEEIIRSLRETRPHVCGHDLAGNDLPPLPQGIQDVIQDRVQRLAPHTREALAAAAVLGQNFNVELLEAVLNDDRTSQALDVAVRAGLIVDDGDGGTRCHFRHALARESILLTTGPRQRAYLHLQAARALERCRDTTIIEAAELAHHYVESRRSDVADKAVCYSCEAAERARASHAYEDATRHYRTAIEVLEQRRPGDTFRRGEVLLRLGEVCWQGGGPRARVIFEQAVALARGLGEDDQFAEAALGLGGRFYAPTGPDEPYIQLLEEALHRVRTDGGLRARLLGRLAEHLVFVDARRAEWLSEEALVTARQLDDPKLLAPTLLSRHAALLDPQYLDERSRLASEEVELARRVNDRELEALGLHWLLYDHLEAGAVSVATQSLGRLQELADELRQPLYRHSALVWGRVLAQLGGKFGNAARLAHKALDVARDAQGEAAETHFIAQQLGVVMDRGGAERLLPAVEERANDGDFLWSSAARLLKLDCAAGSAFEHDADRLGATRLREIPRDVFWLPTLAWLAEGSARTGDRQSAAVLEELLAPYGDQFVQLTFNGSFGCVHRHLGLLAGALAKPREAAEHFDEAVRRHAMVQAPALESRTRCDYAQAVLAGRATGSAREANKLIVSAKRLAEECGATKIAERLAGLNPDVVAKPRPGATGSRTIAIRATPAGVPTLI